MLLTLTRADGLLLSESLKSNIIMVGSFTKLSIIILCLFLKKRRYRILVYYCREYVLSRKECEVLFVQFYYMLCCVTLYLQYYMATLWY